MKRTISIMFENGFIPVEVDVLDLSDLSAAVDLCMAGEVNFRAMELGRTLAADRGKGTTSAVYLVAPEDVPVCKIGIAIDPNARLGGIQNGCWHKLSVVGLLWADVNSYQIEQTALRAAKEMGIHLRGEWIEASPREACELVLKAARYLHAPVYDSATWLNNWGFRINAVAEAKGRANAISKLKPLGGK